MTDTSRPTDGRIDVRLRISALWIAMMFVFAYVDLFSLYRADVRADLERGEIFAFDVDQTFLFLTTLYVIVPSVMIYLTLVMPRRVNRRVNLVVAAVYALTVVGSAVGEWNYFVLGSAAEAALLSTVIHHAWTWRTSP
jgi:hypothetical protein